MFLLFSFLNRLTLFRILNISFSLIMKFVLKPSLEHMALAKIGISLWNQNDVRALISKQYESPPYTMNRRPSAWEIIEESVIEKVSQLSLPQPLKEKVFGVIKPIGIEIFEWMRYYRKYDVVMKFHCLDLDFPAHLLAELCWAPQGTVDRKRTAELLVRNENLNVSRRYILACDYCLENDIIRFWNRLPEDLKDYNWWGFPVVSFWSDNMKRGGAGHISYEWAFSSSVIFGSKVAAKYFLQKITTEEREEFLEECPEDIIRGNQYVDVLCFLLPEMEEEEQKKVLKNYRHGVLQCFLQWPRQSFFNEVANCMWVFLSRDNFDEILGAIIGKVRDGYKDYNYQKLFREFWQNSPRSLKDSPIEEIDKIWLTLLFDIKDKENIQLILKDATLEAKEKLICSDEIKNVCLRSIRDNEWDFLEFFIRECLPSKNEMLKFKVKFEKSVMHSFFKEHFATKKQEWNQLFHLSDDSVCEYVKRSEEEGESSSSKRFQSLQ